MDELPALDPVTFMARYWQRQPVVIRACFAGWPCPVTPDGLLSLATREDADARLIVMEDEAPELLYGPFDSEDFDDLPAKGWTVLVQEVDRLLPAVAALQDTFRFLPNWRLDDVMVSLAAPGGGVGAHTDEYDVFLVNGMGRRRWSIGGAPVDEPHWKADWDVAVLEAFEPAATVELGPGDVLYLPPRFAHEGVALDTCITLSVGFRAPSTADMLSALAGYAMEEPGTDRFGDAGVGPATDPGLFSEQARSGLRERLLAMLSDASLIDAWLGRMVTEPVRGRSGEPPDAPLTPSLLRRHMEAGDTLQRACVAQLAWYPEGADGVLFAAGQVYRLPAAAARLIAGREPLEAATLAPVMDDPRAMSVIVALVNDGVLTIAGE